MKKEKIFSTNISVGTYRNFIDDVFLLAAQQRSSYVCFANVHMIVEAHYDATFNTIINQADVTTPDGRPLSIFLNLTKKINQPRICGMDVFPDVLKEAERRGMSVYFYGNTEDVLQAIKRRANHELPLLRIAGHYAPPFRALTDEEEDDIVRMINDTKPDLLFVSLGCPKQEKWMAAHQGKINACMLGLGQAFGVYAGKEKRLPAWMRSLSLEWFYRLMLEPRRLWKRYAFTNTVFILLTLKFIFLQWLSPAMTSHQSKHQH